MIYKTLYTHVSSISAVCLITATTGTSAGGKSLVYEVFPGGGNGFNSNTNSSSAGVLDMDAIAVVDTR